MPVQGFGKARREATPVLAQTGVAVVSVSDITAAVYLARGLDVEALVVHADQTGSIEGFTGAEMIDHSLLLELDVDVLVPATVEGVITASDAHAVRARAVVEGANGPTTAEADTILSEKGVLVVPDILANAVARSFRTSSGPIESGMSMVGEASAQAAHRAPG